LQFTSAPSCTHIDAMHPVMEYIIATKNRGLEIKPNMSWNGEPDFEFIILGRLDSDYAKDKTQEEVLAVGQYSYVEHQYQQRVRCYNQYLCLSS
jgi:hypothetical protein